MEAFLKSSNFSTGSNFGLKSSFKPSNYYQNNGPMEYVYQFFDYIARHPAQAGTFIVCIPVFALMIHGFVRKNIKLGFTSLLLFFAVILIAYIYGYKIGEPQHYALLIVLIIVLFGFMVKFATEVKEKVHNGMYVKFYNPTTYKRNKPINLSFYGKSGDNDTLLKLMKGNLPAFALKEDLPIDLGSEGTYSFWLKVCPNNFNKFNTQWRSIWYRGDSSGKNGESIYKLKTPGVYLAPNTNKIIISVACENGPDEGNAITIDDIPLNEWFCVTITLEGRSLDCYINGLLEYSISLTGHPKMMNSNIVKGKNGFNGLMAFFRYNSASMLPGQIKNLYDREKATLEDSVYDLETCTLES